MSQNKIWNNANNANNWGNIICKQKKQNKKMLQAINQLAIIIYPRNYCCKLGQNNDEAILSIP
jgi:hypothetical protein